jgi:flagellar hook-length control protein FliK
MPIPVASDPSRPSDKTSAADASAARVGRGHKTALFQVLLSQLGSQPLAEKDTHAQTDAEVTAGHTEVDLAAFLTTIPPFPSAPMAPPGEIVGPVGEERGAGEGVPSPLDSATLASPSPQRPTAEPPLVDAAVSPSKAAAPFPDVDTPDIQRPQNQKMEGDAMPGLVPMTTSPNALATQDGTKESPANFVVSDASAALAGGPRVEGALVTGAIDFGSLRSAPAPYTTHVDAPLGSQQWVEETSDKILLLVQNDQRHAEIRLNPAEMGPIEVHIEVAHGETTIHFSVATAETRTALQEALPHLQEVLTEAGIGTASATVGDETQRERPRTALPNGGQRKSADEEEASSPATALPMRRSAYGLSIDLFA